MTEIAIRINPPVEPEARAVLQRLLDEPAQELPAPTDEEMRARRESWGRGAVALPGTFEGEESIRAFEAEIRGHLDQIHHIGVFGYDLTGSEATDALLRVWARLPADRESDAQVNIAVRASKSREQAECPGCGAKNSGRQTDHKVRRAWGGRVFSINGDCDHLQELCAPCHSHKTAIENRMAPKVRRRYNMIDPPTGKLPLADRPNCRRPGCTYDARPGSARLCSRHKGEERDTRRRGSVERAIAGNERKKDGSIIANRIRDIRTKDPSASVAEIARQVWPDYGQPMQ